MENSDPMKDPKNWFETAETRDDGKKVMPLIVGLGVFCVQLEVMSHNLVQMLAVAYGDDPENARPIMEKMLDLVDAVSARCGRPAGTEVRRMATQMFMGAIHAQTKEQTVILAPLESAVDEWPEEVHE